jgi:hypothetical protein
MSRGLRALILASALASASCGGGGGASRTTPTQPTPPPPGLTAVLVGAGDIGVCDLPGAAATATLLDAIPGTVFTAGDNAYFSGTPDEFQRCYAPSWGRHRSRTRPTPGNHDYGTAGAAGYFAYFGPNAGDPGLGYYSFNAGSWHIVSLNSNIPAGEGSAQYQWLAADLAETPSRCLAAVWHHPLYSSAENGSQPMMRAIWTLLQQAGAEFVVSGHDHVYERFAPQDASGQRVATGVRQFVAGTGGAALYAFRAPLPASEVRASTWGVLKLTLNDGSYMWEFVGVAGSGFTDAGIDSCH